MHVLQQRSTGMLESNTCNYSLIYSRMNRKPNHQSFLLILSESRHDFIFVYTLFKILFPFLKEIVPKHFETAHCCTDSLTEGIQKQNHLLLAAVMRNSLSVTHRGITRRLITGSVTLLGTVKTDQAVENGTFVIQDAV